jgi:hypothetical protein
MGELYRPKVYDALVGKVRAMNDGNFAQPIRISGFANQRQTQQGKFFAKGREINIFPTSNEHSSYL